MVLNQARAVAPKPACEQARLAAAGGRREYQQRGQEHQRQDFDGEGVGRQTPGTVKARQQPATQQSQYHVGEPKSRSMQT